MFLNEGQEGRRLGKKSSRYGNDDAELLRYCRVTVCEGERNVGQFICRFFSRCRSSSSYLERGREFTFGSLVFFCGRILTRY